MEEVIAAMEGPGRCKARLVLQLIGRIRFARAQTFGRCGAGRLRELGLLAKSRARSGWLTPRIRENFDWWRRFFRAARPRLIRCLGLRVALLFTDGAYEGGVVTIGAVLFLDTLRQPEYWGAAVPHHVVEKWKDLIGGEHVIGQGELLPSAAARETWAGELRDLTILHFLDNTSAVQALVKGYSPSADSAPLLDWVADADVRLGARPWYDRVPSPANPADAPSRLDYAACREWKWREPQVRAWGRARG